MKAKTLWLIAWMMFMYSSYAQKIPAGTDTVVSFKVFGNCELCKERIEEASIGRGVRSAIGDVDSKIFTLTYDPSATTVEKVQQRIADAGHDTELKKAKDYVYKQLPDCCLYRDGTGTHHDNKEDHSGVLSGVVMEADEKGNFHPLQGANVMWLGTKKGTTTDSTGVFKIFKDESSERLLVSYAGYKTDTISVTDTRQVKLIMAAGKEMKEVKVTARQKSSYVFSLNIFRTETMTDRELFKAACCNLSESFETNPSVDVSYNDAVTGSKQIQLLGLSGNYTQLTVENLPGPRGLATPLGLNSIAGPWVESIQLTKGTGSVANGFESIAGQINVELRKPETADRLFANAYLNDQGKTDLNLNLAQRMGKKWSVGLLLHDDFNNNQNLDFNKDGFRDLPTGNLFSAVNRWKFDNAKGVLLQFGVKMLNDSRTGGETKFDSGDKFTTTHYGMGIETKRFEEFAKIGYVFPGKKYKSIGLQLSSFQHEQNSYFGLTAYNAHQENFYSNLIYQSIIGTTAHKFRTGVDLVHDNYDEDFRNTNYKRIETVPGAFFEYTFSPVEKFSAVAGLRYDYNNLYGSFFTPRLHLRYEPVKGTTIRLSGGRGQRTSNIFAENIGILASSRQVSILGNGEKGYGLDPEVAWNEGLSVDHKFNLFGHAGTVAVDFFRTDFQQQVVVDMDQTARAVSFYNLTGKSFSNSFQAEITYELLPKFDMRLAYRLFDVKTNYHGELLERPLVAKHRAFANLAYEGRGWKFDYTVTHNGTKRIPYTMDNPFAYQLQDRSPAYVLMNGQVSKTIGKKNPLDVYVGGENLNNYFQERPIIAADQPFGQYFDASLVWGPLSGRMFYAGIRYKIK